MGAVESIYIVCTCIEECLKNAHALTAHLSSALKPCASQRCASTLHAMLLKDCKDLKWRARDRCFVVGIQIKCDEREAPNGGCRL